NPPPKSSGWIRFISRFHSTYFFIDRYRRLIGKGGGRMSNMETTLNNRALRERRTQRQEGEEVGAFARANHDLDRLRAGPDNETVEAGIALFQRLLSTWREAVEARGATFHVVILPHPADQKLRGLLDDRVEVIDLYEAFQGLVEGYDFKRHARFEKDGHWNERGNLLAAISLYRNLEAPLGLTRLTDEALKEQLSTYYGAVGGSWTLDRAWRVPVEVDQDERTRIHAKYRALE
ncbi:MAG: hypothetical protein AAF492_19455, partial [Verrucomicrobiota bacterium]